MMNRNLSKIVLLVALVMAGMNQAAAQPTLPVFQCTLTDKLDINNWPGTPKETFWHTAPTIFFICDSDNVATGDKVRAVWIADHTANVNDAFQTVAVESKHFIKRRNSSETLEANLSLAKPRGGWVPGVYHVQLYVNDIADKSYRFKIM